MEIGVFSKYVKDLIIDLDQVDIPGFGSFYAENVPATISDRGTTINPPFRKMYFRKSDIPFATGLPFVQYVCEVQSVSSDQAKVETEWCLSRIQSELSGNKICELPSLGEMKASSDGEYFFIPDESLDICPDSFGLEPVCVNIAAAPAPVAEPAPEPASATSLEEKQESAPQAPHRPERPRRKRRPLLVILIVLIVLIAAAAVLCYVFPAEVDDFVNSVLYTPEELELLGR